MEMSEATFLVNFVLESDWIEGIVNSLGDLRAATEKEDSSGHVGALLHLRMRSEEPRPLSGNDILLVQKLIVSEQPEKGAPALHPRHIGRYRDCGVSVIGRAKASPGDVPRLMKKLLRRIELWQKTCQAYSDRRNILKVADFHYDFENNIHPFADGNGRTGRALAYYMLRFAGIPPFVFTNKGSEYYLGFANKFAMRNYFCRQYSSPLEPSPPKSDPRRQ